MVSMTSFFNRTSENVRHRNRAYNAAATPSAMRDRHESLPLRVAIELALDLPVQLVADHGFLGGTIGIEMLRTGACWSAGTIVRSFAIARSRSWSTGIPRSAAPIAAIGRTGAGPAGGGTGPDAASGDVG